MAWKTELNGYVKFLRGTPAAWSALETKDTDTLYFISEPSAERGRLYLGPKLISDGLITQINTLQDLEDIMINNNIPTDSLLVYNATIHKWEAKTSAQVFAQIISPMTGATAEEDGIAGLVPTPLAGQQGRYLRGDGTWQNPTADVEAQIAAMRGSDATGTIRSIAADEVLKVVNNAPSNFDTLKDIADWIQTHDNVIDIVDASSRLEQLEISVFGNDDDIAGLESDVSDLKDAVFGTDLTTGLVSNVNTLMGDFTIVNSKVTTLTNNLTTLTTQVNDIDNRLRWQDLVEY